MEFTVISSNPSNKGETHVSKLYRESTVATFVGDKIKKETLYISGPKQLKADSKVTVDMGIFRIEERPFTNPDNGEVIMCKWLHLK